MNLVSGEICEIYVQDGITMAKVSVSGAIIQVPVLFLPEAKVGDVVLIESGVAISKVDGLKNSKVKRSPAVTGEEDF